DVNMPGINGFEAAEKILALNAATRICMLTANVQESSRELARRLEVRFVSKPVTDSSLDQVSQIFLARGRHEGQHDRPGARCAGRNLQCRRR
ncbi:response regulator, partial [Acinetobacter baumannii]